MTVAEFSFPVTNNHGAVQKQHGIDLKPVHARASDGHYGTIRFPDQEEFYDLREDPYERNDLLTREFSVDQQAEYDVLKERLLRLRSSEWRRLVPVVREGGQRASDVLEGVPIVVAADRMMRGSGLSAQKQREGNRKFSRERNYRSGRVYVYADYDPDLGK